MRVYNLDNIVTYIRDMGIVYLSATMGTYLYNMCKSIKK